MQKLSEEPAADSTALQRAAFPIVVALSFSHLLNDMMQSLVPAIYPIIKDAYRPRLRPDRPDHVRVPAHRLAVPAARRHLHRPPAAALFARRRHGHDAASGLIVLANAGSYGMLLLGAASSAPARRSSTPNRRAWRGWPRAAGTALPNRCSRSAARPGRPSVRCWRPSSSCRAARQASPGSRSRRCWPWSCCCRSANGTRANRRPVRQLKAGARPDRRRSGARVAFAVGILVLLMFSKSAYSASLQLLLHLLSDREVRRFGAGLADLLFLFLVVAGGWDR